MIIVIAVAALFFSVGFLLLMRNEAVVTDRKETESSWISGHRSGPEATKTHGSKR